MEPTAEPTVEPTREPVQIIGTYQVNTQGLPLNYRSEPDGEIMGTLEDGSLVAVAELGETWTKVVIDDEVYYVMTAYIAPYDPYQPEPEEPGMTLESLQAAVAKISIDIYARNNIVVYGESVLISASIPEELAGAHLQWQQLDASGVWQDIPGANDTQVSVVITAENVNSAWRVFVTVG